MKNYFVNKNKKEFKDVAPHEVLLDTLSKKNEEKWGVPAKRIETPILEKVFKYFLFFSFLVVFSLFLKTFYLQIIKGEELSAQSDANKYISYKVQAGRGIIYDRNQKQLVYNVPVFNLIYNKYNLSNSEEKEEIIGEVASILEEEKSSIIEKIENSDKEKILISKNLGHKELIILETKIKNLKGFEIEEKLFREYKDGETFAHLIGYTGKVEKRDLSKEPEFYSSLDYIGKSGLEKFYESYLRRIPGQRRVEADVSGTIYSEEIVSLPESGKDLVLYLDSDLQRKIKEALEKQLSSIENTKAVAIAMDPKTGGILSLVSLPSFDNNAFAQAREKEKEAILNNKSEALFNRAISGIGYSTGSVIKPLVASAALQEDIISSSRSLNCQGVIEVEHEYDPDTVYKYHDWAVHGPTDIRKAIAESCNVYFYSIGGGNEDFNISGLGGERIKKYLELFGWGARTGIDLPDEGSSILPTLGSGWRLGDTYHFSIGQGAFSILPIQVTTAYSAIANGGTLFEPQVVQKVVDSSNSFEVIREFEPEIIRKDFISSKNLQVVKEGMRQTVSGENSPLASATFLNSLPVKVAAKTGTAEISSKEKVYHNWVSVFAPYENPEIVITIMFESVAGERSIAVPAAREILNWYFTK